MKIGVVLPMSENPETGTYPRFAEIREMALTAERAGLDSIWLYDHLIYRFGEPPKTTGTWEIWTLLSALATVTERVELGTIVLAVPFRNPAVLAKMADTLDEVSGGRVILGLGAGWHEPEFSAFGLPFDHRVSRFEEGMEIITGLLRKGEVDFQGTYYQATDGALRPRGPMAERGGMPILVASAGERMLRLTAKYADSWNTAWLGNPPLLKERREKLEAACRAEGRDPSTIEITVGVTVSFPDIDPDAKPDDEAPDPQKVITGSDDEVAATLREYEGLGVGHLQVALNPMTPAGVERLATVVGKLRG